MNKNEKNDSNNVSVTSVANKEKEEKAFKYKGELLIPIESSTLPFRKISLKVVHLKTDLT